MTEPRCETCLLWISIGRGRGVCYGEQPRSVNHALPHERWPMTGPDSSCPNWHGQRPRRDGMIEALDRWLAQRSPA